jgi:hypothetical protein
MMQVILILFVHKLHKSIKIQHLLVNVFIRVIFNTGIESWFRCAQKSHNVFCTYCMSQFAEVIPAILTLYL